MNKNSIDIEDIRYLINSGIIGGKEEEVSFSLVLPVFIKILKVGKGDISIGKNNLEDISKRIDILVRKSGKAVFAIEVKKLNSDEFNFFNVFDSEGIGRVWYGEVEKKDKNNKIKTKKGIGHKKGDGTAQLRSYSAILHFSNNENDFYPILTNGLFWILFEKKFYENTLVPFYYYAEYLKSYIGSSNKILLSLYPKIQSCLNSVKYITSVFADDGIDIGKVKRILGKYGGILEKIKGNKENIENKINDEEPLNKIKNKFISFEKFIKELKNIYEGAK